MTIRSTLLAAFALAPLASTQALAAPTVCETYARAAEDQIALVKTVDPATDTLSALETGLIQATMLAYDPSAPLSPQEAVDLFTDAAHGGSHAGTIRYETLSHQGRTVSLARVTFYPGDNEYGSLFQLQTFGATTYPSLVGQIGDGDPVCLTYPGL